MDGSDDYFTDEIILDDETLAVLDKQEREYLTQKTKAQEVSPPTKRQKTENGWKPGVGNRSETLEFLDGLPEVSVQGDGTYGVGGFRNISNAFADHGNRTRNVGSYGPSIARTNHPNHAVQAPSRQIPAQASIYPPHSQRSQPASQPRRQVSPRQNSYGQPSRNLPNGRSIPRASQERPPVPVPPSHPPILSPKPPAPDKKANEELEALRLKAEEVR
jgi:hypothetical protein